MRTPVVFAAVAALWIAGCGGPAKVVDDPAKKNEAAVAGLTVGNYELAAPIRRGNVTIVPVMLKSHPQQVVGEHITLSEAKKAGLVEIIELPGEAEVNRLRVHNKSDRPLLLLGGELLLGGKQDRIVAHDVIVPPHETANVDVDCVDHGRWEGVSSHFDYSSKMVPSRVRDAAAYGDQGQVWDEVSGFNARAGGVAVDGDSTTVQVGLNSKQVQQQVAATLPAMSKELAGNDRVIGVIYVVNGEIQSADLFGNNRLFKSTMESLLHSYLAEAAVTKGENTSGPSVEAYRSFMSDIVSGNRSSRGKGEYMMNGTASLGFELQSPTQAGGSILLHGNYSRRPQNKEAPSNNNVPRNGLPSSGPGQR